MHANNTGHKLMFELDLDVIYYHHIIHDNVLVDLFPISIDKKIYLNDNYLPFVHDDCSRRNHKLSDQ